MPQLPEYDAKTVDVHLPCKVGDFFELLKGFWRAPYARDAVVEEHVAVLHKVKVFNICNSYFHLECTTAYLFEVNKNVVRSQMAMVLDGAKVVDRAQDLADLEGNLVLDPCVG